mmetsp:Transcript_144276/g.268879  ORF Transcript_144276/g.268879 Transcript_144276/m.268879 type:complete len:548 (+) Transcript_144276:57-1700(+)
MDSIRPGSSKCRGLARPVVPQLPLNSSPEPFRLSPRSPRTAETVRTQDAMGGDQKQSPRFGSFCATARPASSQHRQAKSVAAHIANMRRRASLPDRAARLSHGKATVPTSRPNPLLGGRTKETKRPSLSPPTHHRQRAGHKRTPSFEKGLDASLASLASVGTLCSGTDGHEHYLDDLAESDEDMNTPSGSPCTELKDRVGALCEKAENLVQEMSSVMTPPTPPRTSLSALPLPQQQPQCGQQSGPPFGRWGSGDISPKLSASKTALTPHTCSTRTEDFPTLTPVSSTYLNTPVGATSPSIRGKGREEIDDLRFRVSLLELELSKVRSTHDPTVLTDDVASLKRMVEESQEQIKEAREEARETKLQLSMLMLHRSLQSPGSRSPSVSRQMSSPDAAAGLHSSLQSSPTALRHRPSAPAILTSTTGDSGASPTRTGSTDALLRRCLLDLQSAPITPQHPINRSLSQDRPPQQQPAVKQAVQSTREGRPQTARRSGAGLRSSDQFAHGPARRPLVLRGVLEPALTSRERQSARPWRQTRCSRMAGVNCRS